MVESIVNRRYNIQTGRKLAPAKCHEETLNTATGTPVALTLFEADYDEWEAQRADENGVIWETARSAETFEEAEARAEVMSQTYRMVRVTLNVESTVERYIDGCSE